MSRGILSFFCGRSFASGVVRHTVHFRSWLAESPWIRSMSAARLELRIGLHETTDVLNRRSLVPAVTGIRLNIGLVKYRTGDYLGAIEPFASVVREQPDAQQARYLLGLCHLFAEHYGEAVSYLEPLWSQQPNNFMYFYVLGIAAHNAGRKDLDERALNRLLEIGGEVPEFHLILGKAYLNRGEPE